MDEIKKFVLLLWRYRIILVTVPAITVLVTGYIVRNIPDTFSATTQIATGIVDETQQMAFSDASIMAGGAKSAQRFINMTEMMKSRPMVERVSYILMLHDMNPREKPFRGPSGHLNSLSTTEREKIRATLNEKYRTKAALNINDEYERGISFLISSMHYDYYSIIGKLYVYRVGETDFINIDWNSEGQTLTPFVVNTLANEFIKDYKGLIQANQESSVEFLQNLIGQKQDSLSRLSNALKQYKIDNGISYLEQQSAQLLGEISSYENSKQQTEKNIDALKGTIKEIEEKFSADDRQYKESTLTGPAQEVISTRTLINKQIDELLKNDRDIVTQKKIDSLQHIQVENVGLLNDRTIINPQTAKQAFSTSKTSLQLQLMQEQNGLGSTLNHIKELKSKFSTLVPHEAAIQAYDRNIVTIQTEIADLTNRYNQTTMEAQYPVKLRQIQVAMPGGKDGDKKVLLVLLSGIVSGAFCLIAFFVIFFLDNRIMKPADLALATNIPVLGYLNLVGKSTLDLQEIWKNLHGTSEMLEFKKQLRSARFEVSKELAQTSKRGQLLCITSISKGEGKTLISASIAYTYVMINKKVLLIDGNFDNPSITENSNTKIFIEDYLQTGQMDSYDFNSGIMVMGNRGGDKSLLEVADEKVIRERLDHLKTQFDIILVEASSLDSLNKAKEWIMCADKTLTVFEASQTLTELKKQHIHYLSSINGQFIGWILNKVRTRTKNYKQDKVDVATVLD